HNIAIFVDVLDDVQDILVVDDWVISIVLILDHVDRLDRLSAVTNRQGWQLAVRNVVASWDCNFDRITKLASYGVCLHNITILVNVLNDVLNILSRVSNIDRDISLTILHFNYRNSFHSVARNCSWHKCLPGIG